jgi:predicted SAM-dependent methyltransferase
MQAARQTEQIAAASAHVQPIPLRLNLGCSDNLMQGYVNVDLAPPCDLVVDLSGRWPWEDSTVESIQAWDILEHLPSKIHSMNEAWRVLKPGASLDLFVPTTDGRGAFQDPTHQSFWTPNDLFYFVGEYPEWRRFHKAYGITACFKAISVSHQEYPAKVFKLRAILQAVK